MITIYWCVYYVAESWVEVDRGASQGAAKQEELIDLIADAAKEDTRLK